MKINKEKQGWLGLAEKSMEKIWNNKKDEEIWKKQLKNDNPLKELFGALKFKKSTKQILKETRKELKSKWD